MQLKENLSRDLPGGPVVETLRFQWSGWVQVRSLDGELRSHMPRGVAKNNKQQQQQQKLRVLL